MVDYISRNRAHQLIAFLSREVLWEHFVNSIQCDVRTHMIRTSTDKAELDKVPTRIYMYFCTIANAGSTLEYERGRETYTWTEFQHKIDRAGGIKEKKGAIKPLEGTKRDACKDLDF